MQAGVAQGAEMLGLMLIYRQQFITGDFVSHGLLHDHSFSYCAQIW
jgi:hypothetical protein